MIKLRYLIGLYALLAISLAYGFLSSVHYFLLSLLVLIFITRLNTVTLSTPGASLILFLLTSFFSSANSDYSTLALFNWAYLFVTILPILLISILIKSYQDLYFLMKASLFGVLIIMLLSIPLIGSSYRFEGIAGQANLMGLVCASGYVYSIICLIYHKSVEAKMVYIFTIFLSLGLLLLTGSRGGLIAVIAFSLPFFVILFFKSKFKYKLLYLTLLLILLLIISFYMPSEFIDRLKGLTNMLGVSNYELPAVARLSEDLTRLELILIALNIFYESPLLGAGVGVFRYFSDYVYTHSNLFDVLYGTGFLGLLFFHFIYISFIYNSYKSYKNKVIDVYIYAVSWGVFLFHFSITFTIPYLSSKTQLGIFIYIIVSSKVCRHELFKKNTKI